VFFKNEVILFETSIMLCHMMYLARDYRIVCTNSWLDWLTAPYAALFSLFPFFLESKSRQPEPIEQHIKRNMYRTVQ